MNAKFNMPEFLQGVDVYGTVMSLMEEHPEIFYDNTEIVSIFGNFPSAIWNGGGINISTVATKTQIQDIFGYYNEVLNLPLRLTFTNPLVDERHLQDTYCNLIAECGNNGQNEILTSSPILEEYLRKEYPKYKYCASIIGTREVPYKDPEKYDLVVMRRRMNNNWEYLEQIPEQHRTKIEFLCCDPCPDNCPRLYTHYRDFARAQLEFDTENPACECSMTHLKGEFPNHYMTTLETFISREMIDKEYLPRGFNQFKLSGRGSALGPITNIIKYMVKPEYHIDVWQMLLGAAKLV